VAVLVSVVDIITSIVCCVIVFGTLGSLRHLMRWPDTTFEDYNKPGLFLPFVMYPQAAQLLSTAPKMMSCLFFLTMICMGIDSAFPMMEVALIAVYDSFPKYHKFQAAFSAVVCIICCLVGSVMTTTKGIYIFPLFDTYASGLGLLTLALFETWFILCIYGGGKLSKLHHMMTGFYVNDYWKVCWMITCPLGVTFIVLTAFIQWSPPLISSEADSPAYPWWALMFGWIIYAAIVTPIIYYIIRTIWRRKKLNSTLLTPMQSWFDHTEERQLDINDLELEEEKEEVEEVSNHGFISGLTYHNTSGPAVHHERKNSQSEQVFEPRKVDESIY